MVCSIQQDRAVLLAGQPEPAHFFQLFRPFTLQIIQNAAKGLPSGIGILLLPTAMK